MKKENRGGKRKGAGRPTINDKMKPIAITLRESKINELGGREQVRELMRKSIRITS